MNAVIRPEDIKSAIALLTAAGFRVSKAKVKKPKGRVGPTCEVSFADGETVRMTVFSDLAKLDWERGRRIALAAWHTRQWRYAVEKLRTDAATATKTEIEYTDLFARKLERLVMPDLPPRVLSMRFERDGRVLGTREAVG